MSLPKIDDFDLLEIIGTGSFSTVHRARNKVNILRALMKMLEHIPYWFIHSSILQASKKFFAIKCVSKSSLSQSATENLLREIKLLKTLKHKHIVEMTDFRWDEK